MLHIILYNKMSTTENQENSETITTETNTKDYNMISQEMDIILKTLQEQVRTIRNLKKDLDKIHQKELKNVKKKKKSDDGSKSNKEPSGFNKPALVPVEFCSQPWGCDQGQLIPRTQLTKMVYDYIKDNNLQDPADKRIIHPDSNVKDLFHLEDGQDLEFKTFQTYMAKLYKKSKETVENVEKEKPVEKPVKAEKKKGGKKGKKEKA